MKRSVMRTLRVAIAACVVSACWTGAAAAFPGANGKIAFSDLTVADGAISVINLDGTTTVVASGPLGTRYSNPAWSADGTRIAFDESQDVGVVGQIFVVNADGSGFHAVAGPYAGASHPAWSPDGTKLAFDTLPSSPGFVSVDVINADGTGLITLAGGSSDTGNFSAPAWSPDGSQIAVSWARPDVSEDDIMRINVATKAQALVSQDPGSHDVDPAWSPDGSQLAFVRSSHIGTAPAYLVRAATTGPSSFTTLTSPLSTVRYSDPSWSPDGNWIVMAATGTQSPAEVTDDLWVLNANNGSGLRQLTSTDNAYAPDWQATATPVPQTITVGSATLTFAYVTVPGTTTITPVAALPLPGGFTLLGSFYEITTTASFTTATLCLSDSGVTPATVLLHYPGPDNVTGAYVPGSPPQICSTPLTHFSPFALAQPTAATDTTPPTLSVSHVTPASGWNAAAPVPLAIGATDAGSGLNGAPTCHETVNGGPSTSVAVTGLAPSFSASVSGDGVHAITCDAADLAGNTSSAFDTVRVDTTAPIVTYSGNAATYSAGQTVDIKCTASDPAPGSGVASTTCASVLAPASSFTAGAHVLAADATDTAGNVGHGTTTFTIVAGPPPVITLAALCAQTKADVQRSPRYLALTALQRHAVDLLASALCQRLASSPTPTTAAQRAALLHAYELGVGALTAAGWLTPSDEATLLALARALWH